MGYIGMNESIPKKTLYLIPPLPLVEDAKDKDEKPKATDVIEFALKQFLGIRCALISLVHITFAEKVKRT